MALRKRHRIYRGSGKILCRAGYANKEKEPLISPAPAGAHAHSRFFHNHRTTRLPPVSLQRVHCRVPPENTLRNMLKRKENNMQATVVSRRCMAGGPGFEPRLTESDGVF